MFDTHSKTDASDAFRLLVSPYHPDTLRQPALGAATAVSDRLRHALTWNVFKTLEQIAPSIWTRPLIARCTGLPEGYDSAPHITTVTCWTTLQPAPSAMLRRGRRCGVPVSAIIDTDDTVISILTPGPDELLDRVLSETADGGLLDVAEATAYVAGTRSAYVTVVLPPEVDEHVWAPRVQRRAERVAGVLSSSNRPPENIRGIGVTTWNALYDVLSDIAASPFISKSERRHALTTVEWMRKQLGTERTRRLLA